LTLADGETAQTARMRLLSLDIGRHLRKRQVTAGRHGIHEWTHDAVGVIVVADQVQQGDQHESHRAGKVDSSGGPLQDRAEVPEVGVDVIGRALWRTVQQRPGVGKHDRVISSRDVHTLRRGGCVRLARDA
jgi:hypothetical protein